MNKIALVDIFQSDNTKELFQFNKDNWPWLSNIAISDCAIEITDTTGELISSTVVNLDIELLNGSRLTDHKNKEFFNLVIEYVELYRLHNPSVKAHVHAHRITSLLGFICWLGKYNIRTLYNVTRTHIDAFVNDAVYGTEFALDIPYRVFCSIKTQLAEGDKSLYRQTNTFRRSVIYNQASVDKLPCSRLTYTPKIVDWFENQLKNHVPEIDLEKVQYQELLDELDLVPSPITVQDLHRKLIPLDEIWCWKHYFKSKTFRTEPFIEGASKVATRFGSVTQRTRTIPPKTAFAIMSESAKWVIDYSDEILSLLNEKADARTVVDRLSAKGLKIDVRDGRRKHYGVVTLDGVVRYLFAACFTVIASLTARRKEEIFDLGFKCVDEDRGDGAYWLTIYIEKTSQRYDLCPVPVMVKKAVGVLEKLSHEARLCSQSDSLWLYISDGEVVSLGDGPIRYSLQDFYCKFVDPESIENWSLSFHQFRRMFALLYYYRFEGAYIGALSYHLRHFNIEMTKRYITDEKFMKEMKEIGEDWTASFLRRVIAGEEKIGGKAGEKMKRKLADWLGHFRENVDVVERERVVEKLMRYMNRVGTDFTQQVWGTICSCPKKTTLRRYANCADGNGEPNIQNGSEEICGGCPYSAYTSRFADAICHKIESKQKAVDFCGHGSVLGEVSGVQIVVLQDLLSKAESITTFEVQSG
ncbi:hypothetical protein ACFO3I_13330 [Rheinheimera marina]|uniref:Site-specific integrase n=1 Tax=Rheinheimera marina TaxID=1774958 RepID=A0ABV9JP04_9GAMM